MRRARPTTLRELARLRLHNQRLVEVPAHSAAEICNWLGAVQSQDYTMAKWGLGQRLQATTDAELEAAFERGEILRTHAMRPTWHFVAPADIGWLQSLTGPRVQRVNAGTYRRLGFDERALRRADELITGALRGGHSLTRAELGQVLEQAGYTAHGQHLAYLVMHAELEGLICSGPRRGRRHTYVLVAERAPQARVLERDEALAELAGRFFSSHGPATLRDWAWWSGMTMADGRQGLAALGESVERLEVESLAYWLVRRAGGPTLRPSVDRPAEPLIHLLPIYDEHLIAYRDRQAGFDPRIGHAMPFDTSPLVAQLMTSDGQLVGGWRLRAVNEGLVVTLDPIVALRPDELGATEAAASRLAAFYERPVSVAVA